MKDTQPCYYIFFLLFLPIFLSLYGCEGEVGGAVETTETVSVRFEVRLPADLKNSPVTRGMSSSEESLIKTIDIFHFLEGDDGKYRALTEEPVSGNYDIGPPDWVRATLHVRPGKNSRLVMLFNAQRADYYGYHKSIELGDFLESLILEEKNEWYTGSPRPMPMYALTGAVEISKDVPNGKLDNNGYPFGLIRMHAKFNVCLHTRVDNFKLSTVCVFNWKTKGFIPYNEDHWDASVPMSPKATIPHIPVLSADDTIFEPSLPYYGVGTDSGANDFGKIINKVYVFESDNAAESDRLKKTALVIGGRYEDDTDDTYYRIDIDATQGNILRNHLYEVEIQSIGSRGYDSATKAFMGESRMTARVLPWNMALQDVMTDRQYRLTVSNDVFRLDPAGAQAELNILTDYNISSQGFPAGIRIDLGDIIYNPALTAGTEWLTLVDISGSEGDLERKIGIRATANTGSSRSALIYIKAGNMTKVIQVIQ